jgi:hypothetical protein
MTIPLLGNDGSLLLGERTLLLLAGQANSRRWWEAVRRSLAQRDAAAAHRALLDVRGQFKTLLTVGPTGQAGQF